MSVRLQAAALRAAACSWGPTTQICAWLLSSASVCARVHLSARLMDLQEMALGIYYHV